MQRSLLISSLVYLLCSCGLASQEDDSINKKIVEPAGLSVAHDPNSTTSESGGLSNIAFNLQTAPTNPVTLKLESTDLTEGVVQPASLLFTKENWNDKQSVIVTGVDDDMQDGNIEYSIRILPAISDDPAYQDLMTKDITLTNIDNDTAGVTIKPLQGLITSESGGTDNFTIELSSRPAADVIIPVKSNKPSEGSVSLDSVIFTAENWDKKQVVTITGIDDDKIDGNIHYLIELGKITSDDAAYNKLNLSNVSVTNQDNEVGAPLYGLDERPDNTNCLALERPNTDTNIELQAAFSALSFNKPIALLQAPNNATQWYVAEQTGSIKTFNATDTSARNFLSIPAEYIISPSTYNEAGLLGMAFHPDYGNSNYRVFVSYNAPKTGVIMESRIAEFVSLDDGLTLDYASEKIILAVDQPSSNHNGGHIAFGPDGYLYIGLGDGGGSGDPDEHGQNTKTLLGAMLRIDIDSGDPYNIPLDNPFATTTCEQGGCPEIVAWGLRNPWRWNFDTVTGMLWLGDVGQNAYEEVNLIKIGGNYGWNFREGFACYSGNTPSCNNGELIDPIVVYRTGPDGRAITGGFVYRGSEITSLQGIYLFADYAYGTIWGLFYDNAGKPEPKVLISGSGKLISSFGQGLDGELYITNLRGDISKIVTRTPIAAAFPNKLSATGCMDLTDTTKPGPALIPYNVNLPLWTDGAIKQRWLALPNDSAITIDASNKNNWEFPIGSVFIKHFYLNSALIETRTLMRHSDGDWGGYSYAWDDDGLDATLVTGGKTKSFDGINWTYPSSAQCMACHTPVNNFVIGAETLQLNRDYHYPSGRAANQLLTFAHIGLFSAALADEINTLPRLPTMTDTLNTLQDRTRAYLHANCAFCHQPEGTGRGPANFHYLADVTINDISAMGICDVAPEVGNMGVANAKLLAPADPEASIIALRLQALDVNRMPPLGTSLVHSEGVKLINDWINSLTTCP